VIAADKRWLNASFQKEYQDLAEEIKEPGRRMCNLFLEKIFQLSIPLPQIPEGLRHVYWKSLLGKSSKDELELIRRKAENKFSTDESQETIFSKLTNAPSDPFENQIYREQAVRALASQKVEENTTHFLEKFVDLVEPNPRSMKRLVIVYSIFRDQLILSGQIELTESLRDQLVIWTIIKLRWPCLADYLAINPDDIKAFQKEKSDEFRNKRGVKFRSRKNAGWSRNKISD
jgi:hypothetical protein